MSRTVSKLLRIVPLVALFALTCQQSSVIAAGLPSGVKHRLEKIDQYMTKVEKSLEAGRANHNDLDRAQDSLDEIKKQYPDNASAAEVVAAEERIKKGADAIAKLEGDKAKAKEEKADAEKAADMTAEQWADKLDAYKADTTEGSKGSFGVPLSDPKKIVELAPLYNEAKKLYQEFVATGIDKESHWKLRQADWDIKVAIENYESSIKRLSDDAVSDLKQAKEWLAGQLNSATPLYLPTDRMVTLRQKVADVKSILPADDATVKALESDLAEIEKNQAAIEKIVLKKRKMKPDVYKGADAAKVKALAKSIVLKDKSSAKIVRVHVISAKWDVESAIEWTDTTQSALQHRVTKGLNVQVALKIDSDCFLYTLFIHKDTIGGAAGSLKGHVMFRDKFLEENLPK